MTSEVVVMNRLGVALAADSAVTVDMGKSSKVRDSALKVFMLSKYRPVGVMVYNNASLLGVPLETIIKLFRRDLGTRGFDTLAKYGKELVGFLNGNESLFPQSVQDHYFLATLETEYRRIGELVEREFAASGVYGGAAGARGDSPSETVRKVIARRLEEWRSHEDADYFQNVDAADVVGRNSGGVHDVLNRVSLDLPLDDDGRRDLYEIAAHLVAKDHFPPDVFSGLVITGFGETQHFPSVQHIELGGVYGGRLKVRPETVHNVTDDEPSKVMAFAYRDMVDTFLHGISADLYDLLLEAAELIEEGPVSAVEAVTGGFAAEKKRELMAMARRESAELAADFARKALLGSMYRRQDIARAVEMLSINELAQVASTLVGLSSFEQQMSLDRETVGGPVDVAVISKGDGFIWIQRKHYFRKELNSHFFQNYYDDGNGGSDDDAGNGSEDSNAREEEQHDGD